MLYVTAAWAVSRLLLTFIQNRLKALKDEWEKKRRQFKNDMKVTEKEEETQALQHEKALDNLSVRLSDCHIASSSAAFSLTGDASEFISVKEKKEALTLSEDDRKKQKQEEEKEEIRHLSGSDEDVFMSDRLG